MKYRTRIFYSDTRKAMMWDRWRQGESLHEIARSFDRHHISIGGILAQTGGPRPAQGVRSSVLLSLPEREEVSCRVVAGRSVRSIALFLSRAPSTISREIWRHGGSDGYRASNADQAAWDQAHRPKPCNLAQNCALARIVAQKLKMLWSPEQIAGWLKCTYLDDESYQVSHETIYRTLFVQTRGALKKELLQHLRRTRAMRRSRSHTQKTDNHGRICNTISISKRPPSVADGEVPGHWEGDLIFGSNNSQIVTLVERQTRYVMMAKVNGKDTQTVINALVKHAHQLPKQLYASLTWDRGKEMVDHQGFTLATDIRVYFCDPQNPWQRGSNENPMACSASTSPKEQTYRFTRRLS